MSRSAPPPWVLGSLAAGALVVLLVGGWLLVRKRAAAPSSNPARSDKTFVWDGTTRIVCRNNESLTIKNENVSVSGAAAFTAEGRCSLTLVHVNVHALVAVEAKDDATVTVQGGALEGTDAAVRASGNAKVTLVGTAVSGKTEMTDGAQIVGP